jgi:plasmid stability protein
MPTLYVENVPSELYEALRRQARQRHRSMASEVIALLEQNVPTERELRARREWLRRLQTISSRKASRQRPFPSTEQMQREDRER